MSLGENVRGADVFILQPTCTPTNDNLMELLVILDAVKRSSARRVTAVVPYYGYARQDRKNKPRVPITAKLVADLITTAGASRVLTLDLHAGQIQGYFDIPVDHLISAPVMLEYIMSNLPDDVVIVSPDTGGVERARHIAESLENRGRTASIAIIDKRRDKPNEAHAINVVGDVDGKTCIIVDDIVDTAGTLTEAIRSIKEHGALSVYACITHGVLSGPAMERLEASPVEKLVVTNSVNINDEKRKCSKLVVLSIAQLLGEAIRRIHNEESISSLFV